MYKKLKIPPQPPVDVTPPQKLTTEERQAQTCDPRSRMAELSADPDRPVAVADEHPHLGGRRIFLHLHNALFEHVPRVRASRLQKPSVKALHLHSAAYHWRRASIAHDLLRDTSTELDPYRVEKTGMDFMEAAIASVYGAVAAVDVLAHEIMFDKLNADALPVATNRDSWADS